MEVLTNDNIKDAVNLWCDNKDSANEIYGHINEWDVSNITDMSFLFKYKINFNDDISNWDVSNVTDMQGMFWNAASFNQPLNNWNVSSVTNMKGMFFAVYEFNQWLKRRV